MSLGMLVEYIIITKNHDDSENDFNIFFSVAKSFFDILHLKNNPSSVEEEEKRLGIRLSARELISTALCSAL